MYYLYLHRLYFSFSLKDFLWTKSLNINTCFFRKWQIGLLGNLKIWTKCWISTLIFLFFLPPPATLLQQQQSSQPFPLQECSHTGTPVNMSYSRARLNLCSTIPLAATHSFDVSVGHPSNCLGMLSVGQPSVFPVPPPGSANQDCIRTITPWKPLSTNAICRGKTNVSVELCLEYSADQRASFLQNK